MRINDILKDKFKKIELSSGFKKYFVNTGWLFFERIVGMVVIFFVGVYVARYLGPANFGLLSYAGSFVGLFSAIATLGLDNIVVRELVKGEKRRDELLGTTFVLKIIGSIFVLIIIVIAVRFTTNDSFTNLLIFIIAIGTIFQSFNVVNFYFQSKVLSKYTVYTQVFTTILCAVIKLLLIYFNMGLIYFAIVILLQSIILASGLVVMYMKQKSSLFNWSIKFDLARSLLKYSWPLILSGIAVSIYMKIDQVMIKNMLDAKAVGNYAVAVRLTEVWYFIPMVISSSLFPAIINAKKQNKELYYTRLQNIYDLVIWMSIAIVIPLRFFSNFIFDFLFGIQYIGAVKVFNITIFILILISISSVHGKWLLIEGLQKYNLLYTTTGMIVNVIGNYYFIKKYGYIGAAYATVLAQTVPYLLFLSNKKMRENFILIINALLPFHLINIKGRIWRI